ncbi:MAG: restriction endonuclease subunit S [Oscillospiraceae bacterium]|nr:restriction endonuclease subunit S [Oscillospiraceae bacterium]
MVENTNKPAIRFAGFTEAWEQRKVGELLMERNEQAPMSDEYPLMAFIANEGVAPKGERYDRSSLVSDAENKLYKRTEFGDFIYSSNNLETGSIGLNKYGKASISPVYSIFQPTGIADSDFLGRRLVRKDFINAMVKWRQGVIYGQWRIHESDFVKIEISVPSVEEQRNIGAYLDNLDNLITLHQRKYEKLVCIKKSCLEKMFPKNGAKVPEIRFSGFADVWEQRKLADLCEKFTDGDWIESKDQSGSGVRLVQTGNVGVTEYLDKPNNMKWVSLETFERLHCEEVFPGDLLISRLPEPAGRACIMPKLGIKMITAVDCTIVRTKSDYCNEFLVQYLSSQSYFNEVNTALAGGTRQRISRSNLASFDVPTPSTFEEQQQIGTFLRNLDNLITLHLRELEKLKNIKKAMLERMFI